MSQTLTIIGQGYVGLPLAQAAVHAGWKVTGFDLSERVVSGLNSGKSHIDDLSDDEISEMLAAGYSAYQLPWVRPVLQTYPSSSLLQRR